MAHAAVTAVVLTLLSIAACASPPRNPASSAVLYEGATLIVGDERPAVQNAAFMVENGRFTFVGAAGQTPVTEGVTRVDLTGKTVMPSLVDAHAHLGYRKGASFAVENYTRRNIIDHLQRLAYHGVTAVMSLGTEQDAGYVLRDEHRRTPVPNAARFLTAGRGLAMPNGGPAPPLRDAPIGVATPSQARAAVRELAPKIDGVVKIWVDDRDGTVKKLTPEIYGAAIEEAHTRGLRTITHTQRLDDVKAILRAGVDALAHPSWRGGQAVDDELVELLEQRPGLFVVLTLWGTRNQIFGRRPAWLDDPLLRETFTDAEIAALENPKVPEDAVSTWKAGIVPQGVAKLRAAGVRFGLGDDAGATNGAQYFGFAAHIELASMVEAGLSPAEAITAGTRNSAEFLQLADLGTVAVGKSADFIVLDANPLDNIHNTRRISAVYMQGRPVDRAALRAQWQDGSHTGG
jgi:imidazolonepropionase-like amidohydrolase